MNMGATNVSCYVSIDGMQIFATGANISHPLCFPVKKGQVIKTRNETGQGYQIYFYAILKD